MSHVRFQTGRDNWNDFFGRIAQHQFPFLERVTAFELRGPPPTFFCPLRMRQATLRSCDGVFGFTVTDAFHK
ncbi:hypothetical protein MFIFM68171_07317 [Madurella fahalii]|uniref:Uncharacterized protein n=1 Tax=Madurella fahalii TaxID=1157608 RepID=A0ABQ0GH57_9PEZI